MKSCHFLHMMPRIGIYKSGVSSFCISNLALNVTCGFPKKKKNVTCGLLTLQENPSLKIVAWVVQISAKKTSDKISNDVDNSLLRFKKTMVKNRIIVI